MGRKRSSGSLQGLSKSHRTMLVLLALPLLAVSAQGQVEDRNHLLEDIIEDLENHQYPDYQYSDQMYDPEPAAPARALHQDDLRAATRQGKQIKSSMLRPTAILQTLARLATLRKMAALRILKTTLNSHKSTRLLRTACVTLSICLPVLSQSSRMEDSPSWVASHQQRKSRIHSWPGQSYRSQQRRGWATRWATRSSRPSPGNGLWPDTTNKQPFSSPQTTTKTTKTTRGFTGIQKLQAFVLSRGSLNQIHRSINQPRS